MTRELNEKNEEALKIIEKSNHIPEKRHIVNNEELFCRFFNVCGIPEVIEIAIKDGKEIFDTEKQNYIHHCTYKGNCKITYESNLELERLGGLKVK
jgi:hypothetical protein